MVEPEQLLDTLENDVDRNGLRLPSNVRNPPKTFDDLEEDDDAEVNEVADADIGKSPAAAARTAAEAASSARSSIAGDVSDS